MKDAPGDWNVESHVVETEDNYLLKLFRIVPASLTE